MKKVSALLFSALFALGASPLYAVDGDLTGGDNPVFEEGGADSTVTNPGGNVEGGDVTGGDNPVFEEGGADSTVTNPGGNVEGGDVTNPNGDPNADRGPRPTIAGGVISAENGVLVLNFEGDLENYSDLFSGEYIALRGSNGQDDDLTKPVWQLMDRSLMEGKLVAYLFDGETQEAPSADILQSLVGSTYFLDVGDMTFDGEPVEMTDSTVRVIDGNPRFARTENSLVLRKHSVAFWDEGEEEIFAIVDTIENPGSGNVQTGRQTVEDLINCMYGDDEGACEETFGSGAKSRTKTAVCAPGKLCEIVFDGLDAAHTYSIRWGSTRDLENQVSSLQSWLGRTVQDGNTVVALRSVRADADRQIFVGLGRSVFDGCWMVKPAGAPSPNVGELDFGPDGDECSDVYAQLERSGDVAAAGGFSVSYDGWDVSRQGPFDFAFDLGLGGSGDDGNNEVSARLNTYAGVHNVRNSESAPFSPDMSYSLYLFTTDSVYANAGVRAAHMVRVDFPVVSEDTVFAGTLPFAFGKEADGAVAWSRTILPEEEFMEAVAASGWKFRNGLKDSLETDWTEEEPMPEGGVEIEVPRGHFEPGSELVLAYYTRNGDNAVSPVHFLRFNYADDYALRFAIDYESETTAEKAAAPYGWATKSDLSDVEPLPADSAAIPLSPGARNRTIYVVRDVNARTPALAWTIEVPARPETPEVSVPENDAQIVYLDTAMRWDSSLCGKDGVLCEGFEWPKGDGSPVLLDEYGSLRYFVPATETSFRSDTGVVRADPDGFVFAPYAELSGQYVRLNAAKEFSSAPAKSALAFYSPDGKEVNGPAALTRYDVGYMEAGKHIAYAGLYVPRTREDYENGCTVGRRGEIQEFQEIPDDEDGFFAQPAPPEDDGEPAEGVDGNDPVQDSLLAHVPAGCTLIRTASAEIDVPELSVSRWTADTSMSSWVMTGLGGVVPDVAETELADRQVMGWDESDSWDPRWAKYRALESVPAGSGVWIWIDSSLSFRRTPEKPSSVVSVRLKSRDNGWNLLANPYPYKVSANVLEGAPIYVWNRELADYEPLPESGVLEPFQAYWIQAEESANVNLPNDMLFDSDVETAPAAAEPDDLMRVALRAGAYRDVNNYVGVGDSARSRGEFPLAMGAGVTLTSLRDGEGLQSDVREADDVLHWSFAVSSRVSGLARGELELENREALESLGYRLWTSQNGKLSEVRGDAPVAVALPASGSRVELYAARSKDLLEKELSRGSSGWKVRSSWDRAQGRADFRFSLDEPADLELRLLDASGRPIASQSASFGAGSQSWSWSASAPPASAVFWSISGGNLRAEGSF